MPEEKAWVRLCAAADAPAEGGLALAEAAGHAICLANLEGTLRALGNLCPHRQGPLNEGWIEGGQVVCPWHGWSFDPATGVCTNASGAVEAYPVRLDGDSVLVQIG